MTQNAIERINRLTDARVRAGLSIRDLAGEAGVSEDTIKRAENGRRIGLLSRQRIVEALSRKLGITYVRADFWPEEVAS